MRGKRRGRRKLEERTEEGTEETEQCLEVTEEGCEEERCQEDWDIAECHSAAKRARVCATFTDCQETGIVEFVKQHPELYDKENGSTTGRGERPSGQKSLQN